VSDEGAEFRAFVSEGELMPVEFLRAQVGKTRFVRILQDCLVGGQHKGAGQVFELSDEDAIILTSMQKAEYVKPPVEEAPKKKGK
jgi:hypothetical protein